MVVTPDPPEVEVEVAVTEDMIVYTGKGWDAETLQEVFPDAVITSVKVEVDADGS